jgi:hypothetical protein
MQRQYVPKGKMVERLLKAAKADADAGHTVLDGETIEDYIAGLKTTLQNLRYKVLVDTYDAMVGFEY